MRRLGLAAALALLAGCLSPSANRGSAVVRAIDGAPKVPHAVIATDRGDIVVRFLDDPAAGAAAAFREIVSSRRAYDGTGFYRVLPGYIAQGGDRADGPVAAPTAFAPAARGQAFTREGLVGFCDPAASGAFFVTLGPAPWLNSQRAPFGEVVSGIELLRALAQGSIAVFDGAGNRIDRPDDPLRIREVRIEDR